MKVNAELISYIINLLIKSYAMTICELGIIYNVRELIRLWRKS